MRLETAIPEEPETGTGAGAPPEAPHFSAGSTSLLAQAGLQSVFCPLDTVCVICHLEREGDAVTDYASDRRRAYVDRSASAHAAYSLHYHLVWSVRARRPLLVGDIAQACGDCLLADGQQEESPFSRCTSSPTTCTCCLLWCPAYLWRRP